MRGRITGVSTPGGDTRLADWYEEFLRSENIQRYQREMLHFPAERIEGTFRPIREPVHVGTPISDALYRRAEQIRYNNRNWEGLAMVITPAERNELRAELVRREYLRWAPDGEGVDRFLGIPIVVR